MIRLFGASLGVLLTVFAATAPAQTLAFPEAEGFGRFATGARTNLASANIYHVTNLNNSGAGSLRDALSASNRFVVFDVGGIINLTSVVTVASNITIAGQTAPGGIQVFGNRVAFHGANNLVSRHWGIRKGASGGQEDAVSIDRGTNMIFDHMSVTWGVDGTFDINVGSGQTLDNITIQNTIVGQGLNVTNHSTGGLMVPSSGGRVSVIKSLYADNKTRNPKVRGENEFINNVVYGWNEHGYIMGDTSGTSHANVEGNYFIRGPVGSGGAFTDGTPTFHIYANDNWLDGDRDGVLDGSLITSYSGSDVVGTRHAFPTTASMTAQQAVPFVMNNVGPHITRDAVDTRLAQEVASLGTLGGVLNRETDLYTNYGTNPAYLKPRARLTDSDNDAIPDNWETANGLNPANAADWKGLSGGYTRLEQYLNELGANGVTKTTAGGEWTSAATWGGAVPTFADTAASSGGLTHASGNAFARRFTLNGSSNISGGTLDVFDSIIVGPTSPGLLTISGGVVSAGQVVLGISGSTGALVLNGGTLQTGTIATGGGAASMQWNGGTIRATGVPNISIATVLGAAGGVFDNNGFSGVISGVISGGGALTKLGVGTLTLSGNNSYGGGTTVTGSLKLAHNNGAGTGPISITSAGGAVELASGVTVTNDIKTSFNFEVLDVPDAGAAATYAGNLSRNTSGATRIQASGAGSTLNITGTITAPNGFYLKQGNVVVANNGSITGGGGAAVGRGGGATTLTLRNNANFNVGGFSMGGGQALPSSVIIVRDNATLSTGAANLDLLSTTTATSTSELALNGGVTTVGGFIKTSVGAAQISKLNFNGGTLRYGGATTNTSFLPVLTGLTANVQAGGARIDDAGQAVTLSQSLIHDATLATVDGGLTKLGAGTLTLAGANTYTGATTVSAGTLLVNSTTGGGLTAVAQGATLGGGGTVAGGLSAAGIVSPGNSAGTLSVTGNATLTSTATLKMELGGTTAGSGYDRLVASGQLALDGQLNVVLINGYSPTVGSSFDLFNSASVTGVFGGVSLPPIQDLRWDTTRLYLDGTVKLAFPGDFDGDQTVSDADLVVWQNNFGINSLGDADDDGDTDGDDYLIWQRNLGLASLTRPAADSVPEPTAAALLVIGALTLRRRLRRSAQPLAFPAGALHRG